MTSYEWRGSSLLGECYMVPKHMEEGPNLSLHGKLGCLTYLGAQTRVSYPKWHLLSLLGLVLTLLKT